MISLFYFFCELNWSSGLLSWFPYLVIAVIVVGLTYYLLLPPCIVRDFRSKYNVKHHKNVPPLYPNGWVPIIESSAVNSSIVNVQFCGEEVIVFRGSNGDVHILDAYCPHLGAKLSSGGRKTKICNEDCVRCPFHGWVFRATDGVCVYVPYTVNQNAPKGVRIKTWANVELNGFIYVWFHADGVQPTYEIPNIEQINSKWFYRGRSEHILNAVYQDIPENGADSLHFSQLHTWSMLLGNDMDAINNHSFLSTVVKHTFESSWNPCDGPDGHKSMLTLAVKTYFLGIHLLTINMNVEQIGPSVVHLYFKTTIGIEGIYTQNVVPVQPFEQKIIHRLYLCDAFFSKLFAKFLLYGEATMLERDIIVWRDKKYISNPKFVKEDQPIIKYRKWFAQFYSQSSKTQCSLDW